MRKRCSQHQCTTTTAACSFPNSHYRDILSGQHVVGKHNCVDGTEACPGTDLFRYSDRSGRVEQLGEHAQNV